MRVLIGCERSGVVREAFRKRGHDAWSCDVAPADDGSGYHIQGNVLDHLAGMLYPPRFGMPDVPGARRLFQWDLAIFHPPCTDLAVSGARWFAGKRANGSQDAALAFVRALLDAPIARIALENPVSIISSRIRKPDQTIQPWQFGHGEVKRTCFWLKNLPLLVPTNIVEGREARVWKMAPSSTRAQDRSRTYQGIADAMAAQWGVP